MFFFKDKLSPPNTDHSGDHEAKGRIWGLRDSFMQVQLALAEFCVVSSCTLSSFHCACVCWPKYTFTFSLLAFYRIFSVVSIV